LDERRRNTRRWFAFDTSRRHSHLHLARQRLDGRALSRGHVDYANQALLASIFRRDRGAAGVAGGLRARDSRRRGRPGPRDHRGGRWSRYADDRRARRDHERLVNATGSRKRALNDIDRLFREYHQPLVRYLTRRLGDRDWAEEVAQETFLRAVKQE